MPLLEFLHLFVAISVSAVAGKKSLSRSTSRLRERNDNTTGVLGVTIDPSVGSSNTRTSSRPVELMRMDSVFIDDIGVSKKWLQVTFLTRLQLVLLFEATPLNGEQKHHLIGYSSYTLLCLCHEKDSSHNIPFKRWFVGVVFLPVFLYLSFFFLKPISSRYRANSRISKSTIPLCMISLCVSIYQFY